MGLGAAVLVDGLPVVVLGLGAVAGDEGLSPGEETERHRTGLAGGQLGQQPDHTVGGVGVAGALGRLDEIGQHELDLRGVVDARPEAGVGGVIVAFPELEDAARIVGEDELVSLALAVGLVGHRVQQGIGAVGLSAPRRQDQRPDPPGLPPGFCYGGYLGEAPFGFRQVPGEQASYPGVAERQRQGNHRPLLPGGGFHPPGQLTQPGLVSQDGGIRAGGGEPLEHLGGISGFVPHGVDRLAEQRRGRVQATKLEGGIRVEQQVADRGGRTWWQRKRLGHLGHVGPGRPRGRERAVDLRFHDGFDENVAGQPDVDRTQTPGRGEQGGGRFGRLAERMMNAALYPLGEAEVTLIVAVGGGFVELGLGPAERPSAAARLRRAEHPARSCGLAGAERGRAVEEGCRHRPAAATTRPFPGPLEVIGRGLVRAGSRLGLVPGSLIWLGRAGGFGEAGVHPLALRERSPVVDRGADQRMTEADHVADRDQLPRLSVGRRFDREAEVLASPPQQAGITGRVGGRGEQQGLGVGRQPPDLPEVTLLELAAQRHRLEQGRVADDLSGGEFLADLDEGQRVAACLGDDPSGHQLVQRGPAAEASRSRASASASPAIRSSGSPSSTPGCGAGSRAAKMIAMESAYTRRATNARASADSRSRQ